MTISEVMTTWQDYDTALDRVLDRVQRQIVIFDRDLERLSLDRPDRISKLRRLVLQLGENRMRIVVRDDSRVLTRHPRLVKLLAEGSDRFFLRRVVDSLAHLNDSLVIADNNVALVRFHDDHARCRLIEDDAEAVLPYLNRCEEIWQEGGTPISPRRLGL